jgi:periplasmic protein TonB
MRDMLDDDEVEHAPEPQRWRYWLGAGVGVAALLVFFMIPHHKTQRAKFDSVTTINLPPPPPPKPPKPPEPEKNPTPSNQQKMVSTATPHASSSHSASHGAPLTAMAGAGSNAYGLQAGDGSGGDTIGGDDSGPDYSQYSPGISAAMQNVVSGDQDLSAGAWRARVRFWINGEGVITRAELAESSGDSKRDQLIQSRVMGVKVISNPPADLPQPITIAITSTQT